MTKNDKKKRWIYLPLLTAAFVFGLFYLTKIADYLTLPFLSILLLTLTFLEVYPSDHYFSKRNLMKMISALLAVTLAAWYQITVFILG